MRPALGYKASPFIVRYPARWESVVFEVCWWVAMLYLIGGMAFVLWSLL